MNILIAGAWPYANGSLHIGHIAALLPGDILARYHRLKGDTVCYVSGSDCHGTPIVLRSRKEGISPAEIADRYHREFEDCFRKLGFSYDYYGKTSSEEHKAFVIDFHKKLYKSGYVYEKTQEQVFCETCNQFLPDRFVVGTCPFCNKDARGDQCEHCGNVLDPESLLHAKCSICGSKPVFKPSTHLFLALTRFGEFLTQFVSSAQGWRKNAIGMSERYIKEGLRDRALTRDMDWGIDVPHEGYKGKKVYIWAENVLGYLSASFAWSNSNCRDWYDFWGANARHYYVHGKDNIPFHSIILTAMLKAYEGLHLPDRIVSSEYLTLEGRKISTSQNWAIWVPDILKRYDPDSIRYFLTANGPEKRDTDFTWREFINSHNGELLGAYGNFVNRNLVFISRNCGNKVPAGRINSTIESTMQGLYLKAGNLIEEGSFKDALDAIFAFIRSANKYFDEEQPWATIKRNDEKCADTLYTCVQIIANLSNLLEPFIPFSSSKVRDLLSIKSPSWQYVIIPAGREIKEAGLLFQRIDKKLIDEELRKLQN